MATITLYAAGSLRAALTETAGGFEASLSHTVDATYGPSGTLKDEIANGALAHIFACANMEHPQALAESKKAGPVTMFARNQLCALARPGLKVDSATLLDVMLDSHIKVAASTPKADPSGDYAVEVFAKAEKVKPGTRRTLEAKALKLAGAADSAKSPTGQNVYG